MTHEKPGRFEVKINNVAIGSVSGGGRYDNLTQAFGDRENLSGVGFSFGVDRIYDAMDELNLFPKGATASSKVLICHLDDDSLYYGLGVLSALRAEGIASEIYPDHAKLKKQLDFANKKAIPFAIVIGPDSSRCITATCVHVICSVLDASKRRRRINKLDATSSSVAASSGDFGVLLMAEPYILEG